MNMRPSWRPFPPTPAAPPPRFPGSLLDMRPRGPPDYHQPCPPPPPLSGLPMPINTWPGCFGASRFEAHHAAAAAAGRWPPPLPPMMAMANWSNDPKRFQGPQVMLPPPPPSPYRSSFHELRPPIMNRFRPPIIEPLFSGQQVPLHAPAVTRFHPPQQPPTPPQSRIHVGTSAGANWPNSERDEQVGGDRRLNECVRDQGSRPAKRTSSQVDHRHRRRSRSPSERRGGGGDHRSDNRDNRHRSSKSTSDHRKGRSECLSRAQRSSSTASSSRSGDRQRHHRRSVTSPSVSRRPSIRSSRDAELAFSSRKMITDAAPSSSHEKGSGPYMYSHPKQLAPPPPPLLRPSSGHKLPDSDHLSSSLDDSCRSDRLSSQRPVPAAAAAPTCYDEEKFLEDELKEETSMWSRCSPSDLHYKRSTENDTAVMVATSKLTTLLDRFEEEILIRGESERSKIPAKYEPTNRRLKFIMLNSHESTDSNSSSSNSDSYPSSDDDNAIYELERKRKHPNRLHEELWYNDLGEMNDGPLCRCSYKARQSGIRHGLYPGEDFLKECEPHSNNADRLFHYRITMSPHTNFLTKAPTIIEYDGHEFLFEGFSMLSHYKLPALPLCKVIRFNIEYTIHYMEEKLPENFTVRGVDLFCDYLYRDILELVDLDLRAHTTPAGCRRFHFLPRFARALEENGKEVLSMNEVLAYLLNNAKPLVEEDDLARLMKLNQYEWQNFADQIKGMIVTYPLMKPCSLRVDQLDRDVTAVGANVYPEIVHFGIRPLQLSYAGNPNYQKAWREYVKFRHLLANKPKVCYQDRHKLMQKEIRLQEMRTKSNLKRDVTIVVSSKGFYRTGIMCDVVQHAMLLPVLVCHLRFHKSLDILEGNIGHSFKDRCLLQLALTHPSYRENFGTNPDHARNSLTNCGIRQPEYGDRRIHYMNTRKRGINTLINIMSRFGKHVETISNINHNERLEFLGDAVVEFLTSIHLFHLFPDIEEGGLATYRAAIVQNQHLAVLAKKLELEKFMLYAHGSDLCHDLELRHAMANCFEALMGALFLDGGVQAADRVFSQTLFSEEELLNVWINYPPHPIQEQEPDGDRQWIESVPLLRKMTKFEEEIGVTFKHIRLLARAFTHRSVGYNHLTLGSNQRLEFLGDTVLQLVASEYLYKFFPEHHEGHLSLLRSSLVNNRTQSVVCNDLGMVNYAIYAYPKGELKIKDRADLLEAFLGALYVDQGLTFCQVFCQVCFFPRLQDFIMNQDWNDPKSKLQQCCLTLRTMEGGEPDIPIYKVIESKGPTNTRIFTVAVYFRGKRLAKGSGHSIQQAEMAAASKALDSSKADLFPQLNHQRRVIERSLKQYRQSQREILRSERCSNRPSTSNDAKQLDDLSEW